MNVTTSSDGSGSQISHEAGEELFLTLWVIMAIAFVFFPCCSTHRKRKLCYQRVREMRWVRETEDEDDWYTQMMRERQARLQPPPAAHRMLRISPSQEDDIRKQYLQKLFDDFTLTLSQTDINDSNKLQAITGNEIGEDLASNMLPTSEDNDDDGDIESPPIATPEEYDHDEALKEMDLEKNVFVYVPMAGQPLGKIESNTLGREAAEPVPTRPAPSGCAVCLSQFSANEKITWSSNSDCSHVFHQDCLLRWFQAVGLKHQAKKLKLCPSMSEEEVIELLFKFPKLCPCCRRPFCIESEDDKIGARDGIESSTDDSSGITDSERTVVDLQSQTDATDESNQ